MWHTAGENISRFSSVCLVGLFQMEMKLGFLQSSPFVSKISQSLKRRDGFTKVWGCLKRDNWLNFNHCASSQWLLSEKKV